MDIILYPSVAEIENAEPDLYMGGLSGFHDSVQKLRPQLSESVTLNARDLPFEVVANFEPESLLKLSMGGGLCAAATGVYKMLKAWAGLQNGRKIKVHFGPQRQWQIETTQLSVEQFVQLVNALSVGTLDDAYSKDKAAFDRRVEEFWAQIEVMRTSLIEQGVNILNAYSDEAKMSRL